MVIPVLHWQHTGFFLFVCFFFFSGKLFPRNYYFYLKSCTLKTSLSNKFWCKIKCMTSLMPLHQSINWNIWNNSQQESLRWWNIQAIFIKPHLPKDKSSTLTFLVQKSIQKKSNIWKYSVCLLGPGLKSIFSYIEHQVIFLQWAPGFFLQWAPGFFLQWVQVFFPTMGARFFSYNGCQVFFLQWVQVFFPTMGARLFPTMGARFFPTMSARFFPTMGASFFSYNGCQVFFLQWVPGFFPTMGARFFPPMGTRFFLQ